MFLLLKRDLRLHRGALLVPLALVLCHLTVGAFNRYVLDSVAMDLLFVAFLPLVLEMRERQFGTLGDLTALPVSRKDIIRMRYLEGFIAAAAMLVLLSAGIWAVQRCIWHEHAPLLILNGEYQLASAAMLFMCFAVPLPIFLRWGPTGLGVAYGIGMLTGLGAVSSMRWFPRQFEACVRGLEKVGNHLAAHPVQLVLLFLALFALSYALSQKAFADRDL